MIDDWIGVINSGKLASEVAKPTLPHTSWQTRYVIILRSKFVKEKPCSNDNRVLILMSISEERLGLSFC
jgi:hypothetical protein